MVKERFEGDKFLAMFRSGRPEFLEDLIQDRRGRQLIYDLSGDHQNSLLLSYAVQRILKQVRRGHPQQGMSGRSTAGL
jgi:hypothetical protein